MSLQSIKSLLLDKELRGLWVSLGAHGLVLLIIFAGIELSSPETHISPINAVQAVAIDNRSENRKKLEEQKQAQRKKDKAKKAAEDKRKQDKLKKQQKIKQEKLKKAAEDKRKKAEAKAAEAKKQLVAKQKLEAKKMAEAKKRAAADKQRKADEIKRKAAAEKQRKQAEAAEFERQQQEEQRLLDAEKQQEKLKAEKAAKEAAARARQEDIDRAIYQQEIARYMTQHWIKPPNTQKGYVCEVLITQSRAGHVLDVKLVACVGDAAFRASVERAANKPDQLPLPRNPAVFERDVRISFEEK